MASAAMGAANRPVPASLKTSLLVPKHGRPPADEERQSFLSHEQSDPDLDLDLRSLPSNSSSAEFRLRCDRACLKDMGENWMAKAKGWLLEVEMGVVWGVAGVSIILFVFAAIWFIDPALLTLVLQFRDATCTTENAAFLVGISNCSWTSCRLGCTREIFKCWQVQVSFEFKTGHPAYKPPWASLSDFERGSLYKSDLDPTSPSLALSPEVTNLARLYPNVRGCGYPPKLNCDGFYEKYSPKGKTFDCWVSTMDTSIAMTELDLARAKEEVVYSLIPLFLFIISVLIVRPRGIGGLLDDTRE